MRLRLPFLTFALIAVVSACGKQDPVADNVATVNLPLPANDTEPDPDAAPPENGAVPATAPQASAAPAPTTSATAIPAALQGRWGLAPADCTSTRGDAKGLLVIDGGELRFYESRAVPSPGVEVRSDSIRGNFNFTGEGQSWTKFERLERNGAHLVRTESNPAASYTYGKC
ncbi:MAG TPA: hypothetical protein VGM04_00930 [Sphingomicrobium sp.]|jgi:hypothetical protein